MKGKRGGEGRGGEGRGRGREGGMDAVFKFVCAVE